MRSTRYFPAMTSPTTTSLTLPPLDGQPLRLPRQNPPLQKRYRQPLLVQLLRHLLRFVPRPTIKNRPRGQHVKLGQPPLDLLDRHVRGPRKVRPPERPLVSRIDGNDRALLH